MMSTRCPVDFLYIPISCIIYIYIPIYFDPPDANIHVSRTAVVRLSLLVHGAGGGGQRGAAPVVVDEGPAGQGDDGRILKQSEQFQALSPRASRVCPHKYMCLFRKLEEIPKPFFQDDMSRCVST